MAIRSNMYCTMKVNSICTVKISPPAVIFSFAYHSTQVLYGMGYLCAMLFGRRI
jgi:hypothetical protein